MQADQDHAEQKTGVGAEEMTVDTAGAEQKTDGVDKVGAGIVPVSALDTLGLVSGLADPRWMPHLMSLWQLCFVGGVSPVISLMVIRGAMVGCLWSMTDADSLCGKERRYC